MHENMAGHDPLDAGPHALALPGGLRGAAALSPAAEGTGFAVVLVGDDGRPMGLTGVHAGPPVAALPQAVARLLAAGDGDLSNALRRLGLAPGEPTPNPVLPDRRGLPAGTAVAAVAGLLRGDVLDLLRHASAYGTETYAHFSAPGRTGDTRRRLAAAFPDLVDVLRSGPVSRAVEDGIPLRRGLDAFCGVPGGARLGTGHLRALRGASWGPMGVESKRRLLGMLAAMPSNWLPLTPDEASAARALQPLHAALANLLGDPGPAFAGCGGRWQAFLARATAATGKDVDHLADAADDWSLSARDLAVRVLLPCLAHIEGLAEVDLAASLGPASSAAGRLLYAGRPLRACASVHARWLAASGPPPGTLGEPAGRWPVPTPPWQAPNGAWIVPLADVGALAAEGAALGHCAGSFGRACASGAVYVASVRLDRAPLSTLEFEATASGGLRARQHRGPGNAAPPSEAAEAVSDYLAAATRGVLALDPKAMILAARHRALVAGSLEAACGYDWRDPEALDAALRTLRQALPAPLQGLGPADVARRAGEAAGKPAWALVAEPPDELGNPDA